MQNDKLPENGTALESVPILASEEKPKWQITMCDGIFSLLFLVLGYVYFKFLYQILFCGIMPIVFSALYVVTVLAYLKVKKRKIPTESRIWLGVLLITSLSRLLVENEELGILPALFMHCSAVYWTMSACGSLVKGETSEFLPLDALRGIFYLPFIRFGAFFCGIWRSISAPIKSKKKNTVKILLPILGGILVAIILLCVILPQLMQADGAFEGLLGNLLNLIPKTEMFVNLLFAAPIAAYLFSLLYASVNLSSIKKSAEECANKAKIIPPITVSIVFLSLIGAYILFLGVIIIQLIPVFAGVLPAGKTYSGYAREGFFELCRVCCITLSVMGVAFSALKKEWREQKAIKSITSALCISSIGLCITALARMLLYIGAYGLTTLRFTTSLFMLFLILVFIFAVICVYKPFNIVKAAFIAFCIGFVGLLCINMKVIIALYNMINGF